MTIHATMTPEIGSGFAEISFAAMPTADAQHLWTGGADAYGLRPETSLSDGPGHPCRHCLRNIEAGEEFLILAYRPSRHCNPMRKPARSSCTGHPAADMRPRR
jgi:hypothetical protein